MPSVTEILAGVRAIAARDLIVTGPATITGEARVQGSKNAANKIVAAAVALPGLYEITNFPRLLDPLELLALAEQLGAKVDLEDNTVHMDTTTMHNQSVPYSLTRSTTSAFGFTGALLGRFGEVDFGKPGGDRIGARPVTLHIAGFEALGSQMRETLTTVIGRLDHPRRDAHFRLKVPSTGAAVNYLLAAAAAGIPATLENAPAADGDLETMYSLMRAAGVEVTCANGKVSVSGDRRIPKSAIKFECSPDRNDAFTWLAYGALSKKGVHITGLPETDMKPAYDVLERIKVVLTHGSSGEITVHAPSTGLKTPFFRNFVAGLAGEFHTDWAPLLEVILANVRGQSRVIDTVFSNRIRQAEILEAMGAKVTIRGGSPPVGVGLHFSTSPFDARYIVEVTGPTKFHPVITEVGYDVRACAAAVMAASLAKGESRLSEVTALYRGYEDPLQRLAAIGLKIRAADPA